MPLKKKGKKILEKMEKTYGEKKGESVFYASINAKNPGTEDWHETMHSNSPLLKYGKKKK